MAKFVDIESPYSAESDEDIKKNIRYARACMRDSLLKGEVPIASHLLYTQPGILDDNIPEERQKGIMAGKAFIEDLEVSTVVYTDLGISEGMKFGIDLAEKSGRKTKYRSLGENWEQEFFSHENTHSHKDAW